MSECNKCQLERLRHNAKKHNTEIKLMPSLGKLGGFDVYEHPKGRLPRLSKSAKAMRKGQSDWVAWFMAIGDVCECD